MTASDQQPHYRIIAIPESVANVVRTTRSSPFADHPTHTETARGHGPCRLCLQSFVIGVDKRILLTYDAFAGIEPRPLPGPVFIHETVCNRYPETGGFPPALRGHALTLIAYQDGRRLLAETQLERDQDPNPTIAQLLGRADVNYIHVRDTEAGCYDFRIEPSLTGRSANA